MRIGNRNEKAEAIIWKWNIEGPDFGEQQKLRESKQSNSFITTCLI